MALCPNCTLPHDHGVDGTDWCQPCVDAVLAEQEHDAARAYEAPQVFSI